MEQVANDGDLETGQPPLALANRERVEQRLRRVFVHTVTGIDNGSLADAREQVTGPRGGVPQHDHTRRHGLEVHRRVDECLALHHAG